MSLDHTPWPTRPSDKVRENYGRSCRPGANDPFSLRRSACAADRKVSARTHIHSCFKMEHALPSRDKRNLSLLQTLRYAGV